MCQAMDSIFALFKYTNWSNFSTIIEYEHFFGVCRNNNQLVIRDARCSIHTIFSTFQGSSSRQSRFRLLDRGCLFTAQGAPSFLYREALHNGLMNATRERNKIRIQKAQKGRNRTAAHCYRIATTDGCATANTGSMNHMAGATSTAVVPRSQIVFDFSCDRPGDAAIRGQPADLLRPPEI